jgi:hypothetical protein
LRIRATCNLRVPGIRRGCVAFYDAPGEVSTRGQTGNAIECLDVPHFIAASCS